MKKLIAKTAACAVLAAAGASAHALLLDFNDLAGPAYFTAPYTQGGVTFTFGTNVIATQDWIYSNVQDPFNLPVSGGWVGTSCNFPGNAPAPGFFDCGVSATRDSQRVSADTSFRMNSVWLSGSDPIPEEDPPGSGDFFVTAQTLIFKLYENIGDALPVHEDTFVVLSDPGDAPQQFFFTYAGDVREFAINGVHGYFAMDDLNLTVPEPGSLALVLASLLGLGAVARKRRA